MVARGIRGWGRGCRRGICPRLTGAAKGMPQGLKPGLSGWLYAGVKTPASLRNLRLLPAVLEAHDVVAAVDVEGFAGDGAGEVAG
jgi:hypothetical protein